MPSKTIDQGALDRLKSHNWPGNVRELENLIRRICALYAEDLITARIIERELADHSPVRPGQEGPPTLAALVERHLQSYFASQPDGTPPVGLYDRVVEEVEAPLIPANPERHPRQSGSRCGNLGPQPQHLAQEDYRSRH